MEPEQRGRDQHQGDRRRLARKADAPPQLARELGTELSVDVFPAAPNAIDRYAIGDRTSGLRYGPGRSLKIFVSHRRQRTNWLPALSGAVLPLAAALRAEGLRDRAGRWTPPTVKRVR